MKITELAYELKVHPKEIQKALRRLVINTKPGFDDIPKEIASSIRLQITKQQKVVDNSDDLQTRNDLKKGHSELALEDLGKFKTTVSLVNKVGFLFNLPTYVENVKSGYKEKSLRFLCKRVSQRDHIILIERVEVKERVQNKIERGFLFAIRNKNTRSVFIVWEAIRDTTATHIFKCTIPETEDIMKSLKQHISSNYKYKRMILYDPFSEIPKMLKRHKAIYHTNFSAWEKSLRSVLWPS
jgi:hypothetical protein